MLVVRLTFPVEKVVEKVANKSGNASVPIWFVVTAGVVIFKGMVTFGSVEAFTWFCASSILMLKSTPFTCG